MWKLLYPIQGAKKKNPFRTDSNQLLFCNGDFKVFESISQKKTEENL